MTSSSDSYPELLDYRRLMPLGSPGDKRPLRKSRKYVLASDSASGTADTSPTGYSPKRLRLSEVGGPVHVDSDHESTESVLSEDGIS